MEAPPAAVASLPVLNNGRAGHVCVKYRTNFSLIFILPKLLKDILLAFYKIFSASCISYSLRFI